MKNQLIERIGIDRSVLYDFIIRYIDGKRFERKINFNKKNNYFCMVEYDDSSPIVLSNGNRLKKLIIIDKKIGILCAKFRKNNLNGNYFLDCSLELSVDDYHNLQNLTADEYRGRIINVFTYLEEEYGIYTNFESIKVKKLEINATFYLNKAFTDYKKAILLLGKNVSPKRYGKDNKLKLATWQEVTNYKEELETILIKNSSIEFKIYNKGKHLLDNKQVTECNNNIMRIEYTIKDKRILDRVFDDNLVINLNDTKINKLFEKYFNRDIVEPYRRWRRANYNNLIRLVTKHKQNNPTKWVNYFLRECRQFEAENGLPLLFDLYDLKPIFRELEPKGSRNHNKKFNRFLGQAIYENDLIGNTERVEEVINKVTKMIIK